MCRRACKYRRDSHLRRAHAPILDLRPVWAWGLPPVSELQGRRIDVRELLSCEFSIELRATTLERRYLLIARSGVRARLQVIVAAYLFCLLFPHTPYFPPPSVLPSAS